MRFPRFLAPRRKYEVDDSMWLVQFGRSQEEMIVRFEGELLSWGEEMLWRSRKLVPVGRSLLKGVARQAYKPVLFAQWGRMPKSWELSFVSKMKAMETGGIPFAEVLRTDLPSVIGEAPSEVLLRWAGRKARSQPKDFAKAVARIFGPSGKPIITGLERGSDLQKMLDARTDPEVPFQSLIDAIQRADLEKLEQIPFQPEEQ